MYKTLEDLIAGHNKLYNALQEAVAPVPYAQFRFHGEVVSMNQNQFEEATRTGIKCKCNSCLCCRAYEYQREVNNQNRKEGENNGRSKE